MHHWCALPLYCIPQHAYVDQTVVENWREGEQSWYWLGVDRTAMGSISRGFASLLHSLNWWRMPKLTLWTLHFNLIDGLVQDCSISISNALEILQSGTKPSNMDCPIMGDFSGHLLITLRNAVILLYCYIYIVISHCLFKKMSSALKNVICWWSGIDDLAIMMMAWHQIGNMPVSPNFWWPSSVTHVFWDKSVLTSKQPSQLFSKFNWIF